MVSPYDPLRITKRSGSVLTRPSHETFAGWNSREGFAQTPIHLVRVRLVERTSVTALTGSRGLSNGLSRYVSEAQRERGCLLQQHFGRPKT